MLSKEALSQDYGEKLKSFYKNHLDTKMHVSVLVFKVLSMNYIEFFSVCIVRYDKACCGADTES